MSEPFKEIKVFFDADALIAGSASKSGASFLLLQLSELGLLKGVTCDQVINECRKNISNKLPQAEPLFEKIITCSLEVVSDSEGDEIKKVFGMAHSKDLPILAAALRMKVNYLVTFNTSHFNPDPTFGLVICKPGELLQKIRALLTKLIEM